MAKRSVTLRLPDGLLAEVDARVADSGSTRTEVVSHLLDQALRLDDFERAERFPGPAPDVNASRKELPPPPEPVHAAPVPEQPKQKPHRHMYGIEGFIEEARPDRGVRMGLYSCTGKPDVGCARKQKQPLDEWNRASVDLEKKR